MASTKVRSLGHQPALDGLRALAVVSVMAFHFGIPVLRRGGYLGVDLFFVLSGFLITALLLQEHDRHARIDLRAFWTRRIFRLGPSLVAMLAVVTALVAAIGERGELGNVAGNAVSGLLYVNNWAKIVAPTLEGRTLSHLWSLAIEEQFYLVWPLVLVALLRGGRNLRRLAALVLAGALTITVVRVVMVLGGASGRSLYIGTVARCDALLVGAALALWWCSSTSDEPSALRRRASLVSWCAAGAMLLLVASAEPIASRGWLSRGGFTLVALVAAALIWSVVAAPVSTAARLLRTRPLVAIGAVSYELYLWHVPLHALVLTPQRVGTDSRPVLWTVWFVGSFAVAALTKRCISDPVQRHRPAWANVRSPGAEVVTGSSAPLTVAA